MALHRIKYLICFLFPAQLLYGQRLEKVARLDPVLKEISGLAFLNDSVLIAHNDSGDNPVLYFLDTEGKLLHQTRITNATNVDWEDITTDGKGFIYISDTGNNPNSRKDLKIYAVSSDSILYKAETEARQINIRYADQEAFPPDKKAWHFDAEALAFYGDSLILFTKSQSEPFDGITHCYIFPARPGDYTLVRRQEIRLKSRSYKLDAVTSAGFFGQCCYLLTYTGVEIFSVNCSAPGDFLVYRERISLPGFTQKEALTANDSYLYIADEYNKTLGGKKLYRIKRK